MSVKVYANEISDGISEVIANNNSVALLSVAKSLIIEDIKKAQALMSEYGINQPDLHCLRTVLVSTGWNNNEDVFDPNEVLKSWKSPVHKQFNYMHNEKDIIGHITGSFLLDFDNNIITEKYILENSLKNFSIGTDSVLYTAWSDPDLRERMDKILEEIEKNEWFVSMEALFPDFDYCLKTASGEEKFVKRDENTSYISKHLRCYGGTGVYQGYKVGRVLREITFSGKGLVNKPANPKSIILETQTEPILNMNEETLAGENVMSEELTKELEVVKSQLLEAQATINTLTNYKAQSETLQTSLAQTQTQLDSTAQELNAVKASLEVVTKERDEAVASCNNMKAEMKNGKRKAALIEADVDNEDIEESLASFVGMSDEAFDKMVAMMMKKKAKKVECKKKEDMDDCEASLIVETEKTVASINEIAEAKTNTLQESLVNVFKNTLKTTKK